MVSVYLSCEDTAWRQPSTNQEEALYQDTQSASTLILNFPASRTVRSKCYLMVYGINNMVLIIPVMVFSTAAHKEGWGLKNWCFWTVLLEKTLESPARRSNQSILKEINPEYLLEGFMLNLKLQYSDVKSQLWKRPWCWERLKAGGEGDNRGQDGWMASPTRWTWVWVNSWSWWWTGRPGVLWFMGSQRVGHDWATELNWSDRKVPNFLRVRILRVQREIYRIKERKEKNCLKLSATILVAPMGQVKAHEGTPMLQSQKQVRKWLAKRIRNAWQGQGTRKSP